MVRRREGAVNVLETTGVRTVLIHVVEATQSDGWLVRCGRFVANDAAPHPWTLWMGVETDAATTCLQCLKTS